MPPLLEFRHATVRRGDRIALHDVTFSIAPGEHTAILGPNGCGKSTLIQTITRQLYPLPTSDGPPIRILGQHLWNVFELRFQLGIVSNDLSQTVTREFSFTGREIVLSGFFSSIGIWPHHVITPEMESKAAEVLQMLEVPHLADRWVDELSSGEARRILIARALVHDPRALLLDEPGNSLDFHALYELQSILRKLAQSGVTILLTTHHLPEIIPEIGRVILIQDGHILRDGPKREVLTAESLSVLFRRPVELLERNGFYHLL
jgi:iron complex transport system ATP-binding protein